MTDDETIQELRRRVRELTEQNAFLAEQVAARDGFLALAAHELRNPMTPIVSRIALLRQAAEKGTLPRPGSRRCRCPSSAAASVSGGSFVACARFRFQTDHHRIR
jgi:signal transduction histidine kinase